MAKIAFTKLGLSKNNSIKELEWNGQKIEVKQYLPISEKLDLISKIINLSIDEHVFYNPCKVEIYELIEVILTYTNINLTDKQSEDVLKLYDLFVNSGFSDQVYALIPDKELMYINTGVQATIKEIYRYRDSVMGIMEQINVNQQMTENGITSMIEQLRDSAEIQNLQELTTQLG